MQRTRLLHGLLIALLVYGQLVTGVHAIGHLHPIDDVHHHHAIDLDCHDKPAVSLSGFKPHSSNAKADKKTNTEKHSESTENCSIYHAFSNLSGAVKNIQHDQLPPQQRSTNSSYRFISNSTSTVDYQNIRAPPTIS